MIQKKIKEISLKNESIQIYSVYCYFLEWNENQQRIEKNK